MFRQDFTADLTAIVEADAPFGFIRFNDGEHAILEGLPYRAASGWRISKTAWLRDELTEILVHPPEGIYLGISAPCCIAPAAAYYRKTINVPRERVTFASIFSHRNYNRFRQLQTRFPDAFVVAPHNGDLAVPPDGISYEWNVDALVKDLLEVDRPIFVAAGPCANIIIVRYWNAQAPEKRQIIIDVGAAIDRRVHGEITRVYNMKQKHVCSWDSWHPFAPVSRQQRKQNAAHQTQAAFSRGRTKPNTRIELWKSDRKTRKSKTRVRTK